MVDTKALVVTNLFTNHFSSLECRASTIVVTTIMIVISGYEEMEIGVSYCVHRQPLHKDMK